MKKLLLFLLLLPISLLAQQQTATYTIAPAVFEENQSITITINGSSINESTWGVTGNALYIWAWSYDLSDANSLDCPTNGSWTNSSESNRLTYNSGSDTYTITFIPQTFYNRTGIGRIGFLIKAKDATGEKKTQDIYSEVGAFQMSLLSPAENSNTIITSGGNVNIVAQNTGGNAIYSVTANGTPITCSTVATSFFTCGDTNVTTTKVYVITATLGTITVTKKFTVIINPGIINQTMTSGLVDGINYNTSDPTKATLVLNAPFKDFVYVAGSFNNWSPTSTHAMKKDPTTGKFWLELTGLTSGTNYAYQYWICDNTSLPTNSPAVVKTADPFSTLVLSPYDDPEIVSLGIYPGLPVYATIAPGQEREVSVLQTGQTSYNWSAATTNFVKPQKKDLIIYEVLVRDFDSNSTYQNMIDKIDYFKNLKINAIQLMPIMEFEGNMSWGYNTVYHMAPDKRYGSPSKLKELIDLCHQNGIAVIMDIALNHVFGRSPLVRMWMQDANNDGWADTVATTTENPYINQTATHAYGVGSDINHFREPDNLTNTYVTRTIQHWIREYKIDGFRWDLTKGITNQCASGDGGCTDGYRSDRVAKLKWYADLQWAENSDFYVIFEHLGYGGSATEETEWADYLRSGNTKGIMLWRKKTSEYAELVKGNFSDVTGVADATSNRFIGYAESHDEERIAFKAMIEAGQTFGNLSKTHKRLSAMGAVHLLVPGPKMIWHFGALGYEKSLFTCQNGTPNYPPDNSFPVDNIPGDCKLDTKPQPQWTENWLSNTDRSIIYNNWAKMNDLKRTENVFKNGTFAWNIATTAHPRLDVWTSTTQTPTLSYVLILTNFTDNSYNPMGGFPFTGTWVNLIDNTTITVTDVNMTIPIEAGGFRVYGNKQSTLQTNTFDTTTSISISPNPTNNSFTINTNVSKMAIYSLTGQLVKQFNGDFDSNYNYDIQNLNQGIYLVKVIDSNNNEKSLRLIKQ